MKEFSEIPYFFRDPPVQGRAEDDEEAGHENENNAEGEMANMLRFVPALAEQSEADGVFGKLA
ncbi:MAG: hypothetical protein WCB96_13160 [Candidatus Aminicenantales bacterium]